MPHTYPYLPVSVPDVFKLITDKVFANVMPEINTATNAQAGGMVPLYIHGTMIHVVERLTEMARDVNWNNRRFPLIALIHDFPVDYGVNDENGDIRVRLIIANLTDPNYRSEDRYRINFVPILYPLYAELIEQIRVSNLFIRNNGKMIPHRRIDHLHWGKESLYGHVAYEMHEYIDGIEIADLRLKLNLPNCLQLGLSEGQTFNNI